MARKKKRIDCIYKSEFFRKKIHELINMGVENPEKVSAKEWKYMRKHAKKCLFCAKKFEDLVQKFRCIYPELNDGPSTLR